jgi:2-hydroxy-6-oxonona-2,4-dienedioate hydrolase
MKLVHYKNDTSVLFISGMFAGSWTWDKCHEQIIGNHILVEEPLMGISNNVEVLVDVIAERLQSLSKPVTVVGNSLGGYVALALAERVPEKVEQVLISGSAGFSKIQLDIKDCLSREGVSRLGNRLAELICYDKSKALPEDKEKLIADLTAHLRNMLGLFRGCNQVDASALLPKIHCPVRALWGEFDIVSPFSDAKPVLEKYGVDCTLVPNSGHSPMYENPDIFAEWVNQCILESRSLKKAA